MDHKAFFAYLRRSDVPIFGKSLSQRQVDGITAILKAGAHLPLDHLAHVLGEVAHETGRGMYPIKETVFRSHTNQNPSDDVVKARLDAAWAKGVMPWVKSAYWRDGFFGRGQIQLTHEANYKKFSPLVGVDLVANPSRALDLDISAKVAVLGCEKGLFTGRKLADYDTSVCYNHKQARRIVNGYVEKQAGDVANCATHFAIALRAAGYSPTRAAPARPVAPPPAPATPAPKTGLTALLTALWAALTGRK